MQQDRIARTIRERRLAADWSTEDLAQRAGIAAATVNRIENGKIATPSYSVLMRLAAAFGFDSVDAMLAADGAAPSATSRERPTDYPSRGAIAAHTEDGSELSDSEERIARRVARLVIDQLKREEGQQGGSR